MYRIIIYIYIYINLVKNSDLSEIIACFEQYELIQIIFFLF